jgi:hypothetical protein
MTSLGSTSGERSPVERRWLGLPEATANRKLAERDREPPGCHFEALPAAGEVLPGHAPQPHGGW